jgi:hypothetical protein
MTALRDEDVKAIVTETLTEQQRLQREEIDGIVFKAVATTLMSFGIEEGDRRELRADLQHLRRWRKSVEQAQGFTFKSGDSRDCHGTGWSDLARRQGHARKMTLVLMNFQDEIEREWQAADVSDMRSQRT